MQKRTSALPGPPPHRQQVRQPRRRREQGDQGRFAAEIGKIDATIELFAPNIRQARRDVSRFARSAHFVNGELTRRCQTSLREANGKPVTADSIMLEAMPKRGWTLAIAERDRTSRAASCGRSTGCCRAAWW
jgi:hypothetical protein